MKFPRFPLRTRLAARALRSAAPSTVEPLESRIAPAALVSLTGNDLSVQGDHTDATHTVAGQLETLTFAKVGTNLHITNSTGPLFSGGGQVILNPDGSIDVSLASLTGKFDVQTGSGPDVVTLQASLGSLTKLAIQTGTIVQDANTNITLGGTGDVSFTASKNILFRGNAHLSTQDGPLTLSANANGSATGNFVGVEINHSLVESTGTGGVQVNGQGGNSGNFNVGVLVTNVGNLYGGAGNPLTINGTGGASPGAFADGIFGGGSNGVAVRGFESFISSHGSAVNIKGLGGGTASSTENMGVDVGGDGIVTAGGSGAVNVDGTGSALASGGRSYGVAVRSSGEITSGGGSVTVTGQGGANGSNNDGVLLNERGLIDATGTGLVSVTGRGGAGLSQGVSLASSVTGFAEITSAGGDITITGVAGGAGSSAINLLVKDSIVAGTGGRLTLVGDSMNLEAPVIGSTGGTVILKPLSSSTTVNLGSEQVGQLSLTDAELDRVTGGTVQIGDVGTAQVIVTQPITHTGSFAVAAGSLTVGSPVTISGGQITLAADQMAIASGVTASTGATLRPLIAGRTIHLGNEVAGSLSLTDAELDLVAGSPLLIGSTASGHLFVDSSITHAAGNVTLQSGGDIVIDPGTLSTGSGALSLEPGATGSVRPSGPGLDVTTSTLSFGAGAHLSLALNGPVPNVSYNQLIVAGQVKLTGATLQLTGGYTPLPGQSFKIIDNDSSDSVIGTFQGLSEGSTVSFNGATFVISYVGGDGNDVVLVANTAPTVSRNQPSVTVDEGQTLTNTGSFADADSQPVTVTSSIGTLTQTPGAAGTWSWSLPTQDDLAQQTVIITAKDSLGATSTTSFVIQANNVNPTPTITGSHTGLEGSPVSLTGSATDPAGAQDPLTFAWAVTKNGQAYASGTGAAINFTPDDDGTYVASFTATDDDGGSATTTHTVTVGNVAPTLTLSGASSGNEGSAYTLNLNSSDPGADTISSWTINWGDGTAPQVVTGSPSSVLHTFADNGNYTISAQATDEDGSYAANNLPVAVANVAPSLVISGAASSNEGSAYTLNLNSSDPGADTISSWTINWGDGTAAQVVSGDPSSVPHTYADNGNYSITAKATDEDGTFNANSLNVAVANVAPNLVISGAANSNEGSAYTLNLNSNDPGADTISSWTINWGDGTAAQVVSGNPSSVPHTYADNGNYSITAKATDEDGTFNANSLNVAVANVAPNLVISGAANSNEGSAYTLNLNSSDPGADTISSWTINWGDGTAAQVVNGNPSSVPHTYADNGNYSITAKATDEDGTFNANSLNVAVANVAPNLVISGAANSNEGSAYTLNLNSSDPGADTISSWTINWGDGTAAQVVNGNPSSVPHTYADNGNYSISAKATDEDGTFNANSLNVAVANVAPNLVISGAANSNEGSAYTLNLNSSDPGADTINSWTINWGDGTAAQVVSGNPSSVPHTYADNGNYSISAKATDEDGTFNANSLNVAVANVAPNLVISGAANSNEGSAYTLSLNSNDPGADTISSWTINWGDGTAAQVVSGNPSNVPHTYADNGNYSITAKATDEDGTFNANSLNVAVANVAPNLVISGAANSNEGSAYTLNLNSSDPGADTISSWTINWGDGTAAQVVSGNPSSVPHTYADNGNYSISAKATDEDGTFNANSLNVAVANVAPNLVISGAANSNEGSAYTLNLNSSDPGADTISSWTINWGDGTTAQVVSGNPSNVPHTYADNGNYSITAKATDEDGTFNANSLNVAVANVAPLVTLSGSSSSIQGAAYSLNLASYDPGADTISSYTINWGDGTTPQIVAGHPGSVTHTYASAGSFSISATATDEDGTFAGNNSQAVAVTAATPISPTVSLQGVSPISEGGSAKLNGSFTDANTSTTHQLTVSWGDANNAANSVFNLGSTSTLQTGTVVTSPDGATLTVTAVNKTTGAVSYTTSHLYKDDGAAVGNGTSSDLSNIVVVVKDANNASGTANTSVTVSNVAPALGPCPAYVSGNIDCAGTRGENVYLTASYTDAGVLDTHKVIIDWGDGTTTDSSQGATASSTVIGSYNGQGAFLAAHKYNTGGIFEISYRIVDDDGASVTGTSQAWVTGVRLVSATGELQIVGASANDKVLLNYKGDDGQGDAASANADDKTKVTLHATFDSGCGPLDEFNLVYTTAQVKSVFLATGAGNDYVHLSNNLLLPTYLHGGAGNDTILGGGGADVIDGDDGDDYLAGNDGNDIILGSAGNDHLLAGKGANVLSGGDGNDRLDGGGTRDVLIGGRGNDDLRGGNSNTDTSIGDILIGGLTRNEANVDALRSILNIWNSNDTYTNIVTQLTKVGGLLEVGVQVFDDHATDTLAGGTKAKDLFFADLDHLHGDDDILTGSANDTIKALAEIIMN